MDFVGWMMDIAREQRPSAAALAEIARQSQAAGYNAFGLYLEHAFRYRSAPWAAASDCVTPEMVRQVHSAVPGLRILPFLNTLGHMEGFIRVVGGEWLGEGPKRAGNLQICPTNADARAFVRHLIADALEAFDDEWVHIGGDETEQLGQCPQCAARLNADGPAALYAEYYGELCRWLLQQGRRPCLWGDMLLQFPAALDALPRGTVIFDWQYFKDPADSTAFFRRAGFDVVSCSTVQSFNSGWCFLDATQRNIDAHVAAHAAHGTRGVLLTTWELSGFTAFEATLPLVYAAGQHMHAGLAWQDALEAAGGTGFAAAADVLGNQIPQTSAYLRPGTWRNLRLAFAFRQNPFALWQAWREDACGAPGERILALCEQAATHLAADSVLHFPLQMHAVAVRWVRAAEAAAVAYAAQDYAGADAALVRGAAQLATLRPALVRIADAGGAGADVVRLDRMLAHVELVRGRVAALASQAEARPTLAVVAHEQYVPHNQAAWTVGRTGY